MIFVTLGTQDKSFTRLLEMIQKQIDLGVIKDKVIVQAGYTKFSSDDMEIFDYVSGDDFNKYIKECKFLITHGGAGNIFSGLREHKKIIAVPRLSKYGEHTNDHQIQIIDNFVKNGYILTCDNNDLGASLKQIKHFKPKEWEFNNKKLLNKIDEYITNN